MPFGANPVDGAIVQRVAVVGAGRVGSVLGSALRSAGHPVVAVTARSFTSRLRARNLLRRVPIVTADEAAAGADLLLLAVGDDALPRLVDELVAGGRVRAGTVVVHPSGRHGLAVLEPLTRTGALPLAAHPAMVFAGTSDDLVRLPGTGWGLTATEETDELGRQLVADLAGHVVVVPEQARPAYHAALAHAANHLTTLLNDAADLLTSHGVDDPATLLGPLARGALEAALANGDAALTGPIVRGDAGTVAGHLDVLAGEPIDAVYRALARRTTERAHAAGRLDEALADRLLAVLAAHREPDVRRSRRPRTVGPGHPSQGVPRLHPVRSSEPEQEP